MTTMWVTDENGNKASIEFWGSKEKAEESLRTLQNCSICYNCKNCSSCNDKYLKLE